MYLRAMIILPVAMTVTVSGSGFGVEGCWDLGFRVWGRV